MNGRRLNYVFFFFAVAITVVAPQNERTPADVSFKDTTVTVTCPTGENEEPNTKVNWYKDGKNLSNTDKTLEIQAYNDKNNGLFYCSLGDKDHYIYIKAKVCDRCVELDSLMAFGVVFADVLITVGIMVMVYLCAKKKTGPAVVPQRATQARQPRGQQRGPPVPDPDYQPLNPATRANDVYAQANRR